jgi:hypothetical protein
MSDHKNTAGESGSFNSFALAPAAIAIFALGMGAATALAPTTAATCSASATAAYTGPADYFPEQYVNQAKEIEPMPELYY